jgi:hypothetical protein
MNSDFEPINCFLPSPEPTTGDVLRVDFPHVRPEIIESTPLEPTPIGPNGVVPVAKVSLDALSCWNTDKSFLLPLVRDLLLTKKEELIVKKNNDDACSIVLPIKSDLASPLIVCRKGDAISCLKKRAADSSPSSGCPLPTTASSSSTHAMFRLEQLELWKQRYEELVRFRNEFGHCLVPLKVPRHRSLAHWVKRQRHQYRMKMESKHSTLTCERQTALEALGFVWDSHAAAWEERWKELRSYRDEKGHCKIAKTYPKNPQLAIWVQCQRRQFKLYCQGKDSNMTGGRINKLLSLGFVFSPRLNKNT